MVVPETLLGSVGKERVSQRSTRARVRSDGWISRRRALVLLLRAFATRALLAPGSPRRVPPPALRVLPPALRVACVACCVSPADGSSTGFCSHRGVYGPVPARALGSVLRVGIHRRPRLQGVFSRGTGQAVWVGGAKARVRRRRW